MIEVPPALARNLVLEAMASKLDTPMTAAEVSAAIPQVSEHNVLNALGELLDAGRITIDGSAHSTGADSGLQKFMLSTAKPSALRAPVSGDADVTTQSPVSTAAEYFLAMDSNGALFLYDRHPKHDGTEWYVYGTGGYYSVADMPQAIASALAKCVADAGVTRSNWHSGYVEVHTQLAVTSSKLVAAS